MNYRENKTNELEKRCLDMLKSIGIHIERNNSINITDLDYKLVGQDDRYCDFQYSADFHKYGEVRVDYLSAFRVREEYKSWKTYEIENGIKDSFLAMNDKDLGDLENATLKYVDVLKPGKMYEPTLSSIIYFIYNKSDSEISSEDMPDKILVVKQSELNDYIEKYLVDLVKSKKLKLNDKSALGDIHGSAFIGISLSSLESSNNCFVLNTRDLQNAI